MVRSASAVDQEVKLFEGTARSCGIYRIESREIFETKPRIEGLEFEGKEVGDSSRH